MRNIEVYHVDTAVPIPVQVRTPLENLKVGESFSFPRDKQRSMATQASVLKRTQGKQFTVRKVDNETARAWRLQ